MRIFISILFVLQSLSLNLRSVDMERNVPQEEIKFERYNESSSLMKKEREKYERIGAQAKPHFILGDVEGFKGSSDKMVLKKTCG